MSAGSPLVAMVGVTKRFGDVVANDAVSFEARAGEVHALLGENGAGKSTLMSVLAGLYRPDAGQLFLDGRPIAFRSPRDAIQAGIGMVYQHFMLVEALTVAENIVLGAQQYGFWLDVKRIRDQVRALGQRFGFAIDPDAFVWQLSLGERQRVEIVRLLCYGARVLVLDEPTAVLTPQESDQLLQTLREMAATGLCIIFISHKLREVLAVADRITVLRRGRVVATIPARQADPQELARLMVGRAIDFPQPLPRSPGSPVLEVAGLTARDDRGRAALQGIDLTLRAGEILGIAGVAGNGQRELAECLSGLRRIDQGSVRVVGRDLTNRSPRAFLEAGVAFVPEDRLGTGLCPGLTLWENAVLRRYRSAPFARRGLLDRAAARAFAQEIVSRYQVQPPSIDARAGALSGGNQQKLLLARELSFQPVLLIAMHPTRGVDIGATETVYRALLAQRDRGTGILLISEDLDELLMLCDRLAVLYEGRLVGEFSANDVDRERIGLLMAGTASGTASSPSVEGAHGSRIPG